MGNLFDSVIVSDMQSFHSNGAWFSPDRKYRYLLTRVWKIEKPYCLFIGLNPSTANESQDDPTIKRVCAIANKLGFGGVYMMNLFALVTPYPEELRKEPDPIGDNDTWLKKFSAETEYVIFAWGAFPEADKRAKEVLKIFNEGKALAINKDGSPKHPLYCRKDTVPVVYKGGFKNA